MFRISNIAYQYRWELTLFIGTPLVVDTISWCIWTYTSIPEGSLISNVVFHRVNLFHWPYPLVIFEAVALGILWIRVRHLNRHYLSLLWLYALVSATAFVILSVGTHIVADVSVDNYSELYASRWSESRWFWLALWILQFSILMGFAIQAGKISMRHGLSFIVLSLAFSNGIEVFTGSILFTTPVYFGYLDPSGDTVYLENHYVFVLNIVFHVVVSIAAVLVLARFESVPSRSVNTGIAAILIVALLSKVPYGQIYAIGGWHYYGTRGFLDRMLALGSFENTVLGVILPFVLIYVISRHFPPYNAYGTDRTPENVGQTGSSTNQETMPGAPSADGSQ